MCRNDSDTTVPYSNDEDTQTCDTDSATDTNYHNYEWSDHPFDDVARVANKTVRDISSMSLKGQQGIRDAGNYKLNCSKMYPTKLNAIPERDIYPIV